jgi:hypothetical protein
MAPTATRTAVVHVSQVPAHPAFAATAVTCVSDAVVVHRLPPKAALPRGAWRDGAPAHVTEAARAALRRSTRHLAPGMYWMDTRGAWNPFAPSTPPPSEADLALADGCAVRAITDAHHPALRGAGARETQTQMQQGVFVEPGRTLRAGSYVCDYITGALVTTLSERARAHADADADEDADPDADADADGAADDLKVSVKTSAAATSCASSATRSSATPCT